MSHDVNDMPHHLRSPSGLTVQVNRNGSIRRMDHGDVILNMYVGSEIEGGPTNLYLRRHGTPIEWTPLLGPRSPGAIRLDAAGLEIAGEWRQLRFALRLVLAESAPAWLWHVRLENLGATSVRVDLVYAQDFALADYGAIRMNEYYVSQYVDYTPLVHAERGHVLAVRQNLAVGDHYPWALVGAFGRGVGFATDALDLHGLATRAGERPPALAAPVLATRRRQHEHSMAAIQDAPVAVAPGAVVERGFFGWFVPNHHEASSDADLACVERALALPEAAAPARGRASRDDALQLRARSRERRSR
jgi:cellobiose phosphorylase